MKTFDIIIEKMKESDFSEKDIIHALAIILRFWEEQRYMKSKNKFKDFELNQMKKFCTRKVSEKNYIVINNDQLILNFDEVNDLVDDIYNFYEKDYPINYDYRLIDPIYFSLFFYDLIDKIIDVKYDIVKINDFRLLRKNAKPVTMDKSESYLALVNQKYNNIYTPFKSNRIIDNDFERLNSSMVSIKENGYPYNNQRVILYNDEPYIRDGQHRVAILKYLYGNVNVEVVRFVLENDYFYD